MWSHTAWLAVIFAYVAVVILGIACECFRVKRRRVEKRDARRQPARFDDVIGFR